VDRLFLDANVLFSVAYREGSGLERLWNLPAVVLLTSGYAIAEARRNLETEAQRARLTDRLESVEIVAEAPNQARPSDVDLPDKDLPILLAALASQATHLITGDQKDFGRYFGRAIGDVRVLRPRDYLGPGTADEG
jgi:predicted nucleic acid-binding protein